MLKSQCLRMWAPIHLRCQCQEVKMLWQKWVQVLFLTPSLLAPFPPDLVAGNWRGEFWRKWRDSNPLKV